MPLCGPKGCAQTACRAGFAPPWLTLRNHGGANCPERIAWLEYTAPILVVGWLWATTRRRPSSLTLTGVALAIAGIMLVLNVFSAAHINLIGVGWALAAAVCAACYFMMSDAVDADGDGLNSITLATAGLIVGAVAVAALGATGLMPMTFTTNDAVVAGWTTSWVVPVIALALIPTAIAYTIGIMGIARLRPRFASLVGLSEVMFAVLAAARRGHHTHPGHRGRRRAGRVGAGPSGRPHRQTRRRDLA